MCSTLIVCMACLHVAVNSVVILVLSCFVHVSPMSCLCIMLYLYGYVVDCNVLLGFVLLVC